MDFFIIFDNVFSRQLLQAVGKFSDSKGCLGYMKERDYNKEVMVPLTSSLYVAGVLQGPNVLVEVGAGYFVEKDNAGAMAYCDKKEKALQVNANKLATYVNQKREQMGKVQGEYNKRMLAMQAEAKASQ